MPFGGYQDFSDCVRKNQHKKNPEAYCASIMHQIEGKQDIEKMFTNQHIVPIGKGKIHLI